MALIELFLGICLLQKGPQDIPYSRFLCWFIFAIYLIVNCAVLALQSDMLILIAQLTVQLVYTVAFFWICLWISNQRLRFPQSMTAVFGTDAFISLVALPLLGWITAEPQSPSIYMILFGLMVWQIVVTGHILRNALSARFSFGFGLALLYFYLSFQLMTHLFPLSE